MAILHVQPLATVTALANFNCLLHKDPVAKFLANKLFVFDSWQNTLSQLFSLEFKAAGFIKLHKIFSKMKCHPQYQPID